MKPLKTAPQILEHYLSKTGILWVHYEHIINAVLKAMRMYARIKSDKAYEAGYRACQEQYNK